MNPKLRKQDQLNLLIRSMSTSEKKYFKDYAAPRSEERNYAILFDEMQKSERYEPEILSKKLRKPKPKIANEKEHLQVVLLKSLRNYHSERHVEIRLCNALTNIRVVNDKGQHEMALSLTRNAMKEAELYEVWHMLWTLLCMENTILAASDIPRNERLATQMVNEKRKMEVVRNMDLMTQFSMLYRELEAIFHKRVVVREQGDDKEIKKLLAHPLLRQKHKAISLQSYQVTILGQAYLQLGDFDKIVQYGRRNFELLDQYPELCDASVESYFAAANDHVVTMGFGEKYKEAYSFVEVLKTKSLKHLPYDMETAENLRFQYILQMELWLAKKTRDYQKGYLATERLKANYDRYMTIPDVSARTAVIYSAAVICFFANKIDACVYWLEKLFADTRESSLIEAHTSGKILFAICHAELQNYTLLPYLIRSAELFLKKHKGLMAVEKATFSMLKKLPSYHTQAQRRAAWQKLLGDYNELKKDKLTGNSLQFFNYILWAENKARE